MNHAFNLKSTAAPLKASARKLPVKPNIFVYVLVFFVAIAMMQAYQLGTMQSEAKSIGQDINGIRAEQSILHERYSFYNNNLSYYFGG